MDEILDRATQQPPTLRASLALFAGWACGLLGLLGGAVVLAVLGPSVQWRPYTSSVAGFRVEFPADPVEKAVDAAAGNIVAGRGIKRAYLVGWFTLPDDHADDHVETRTWLLRRRDEMLERDAGDGKPVLVREDPPGENDLRFSYRLSSGTLHAVRIVVTGGRLFTVLAAAPDDEADSRRFLDSFQSWVAFKPIGP